jgi:hypothetical protein
MKDKYVKEIKNETCKMKRLKSFDIKCECWARYENPKIRCSQWCWKQANPVCWKI